MLGRVKDYIASPKPNGYKSLHTTIIVENQHPLEVQIRTENMHRDSEFGVYAHYLYKEKKDKESEFDKKISWFRQTIENAKQLSDEDFIETLKSDLYDGIIVVQTPKGKVLELPQGSCAIDFAYAIHTDIGNKCVGVKINGAMKPITTVLANGDIVEVLTNPHSKGPSRDWLKIIKTSGARSKVKAFFKNELKDENIKLGKSIISQLLQEKGLNFSKLTEEKYENEILTKFNVETLDEVYAGVGSGSISSNQVVNKLQNLVRAENLIIKQDKVNISVKRNKDGVLVDGDNGMLIRFAGCCNPIEGDDIIGYISHGKGVTIHRSNCPNIKYYEPERLISAEWQYKENTTFTAQIHVVAMKSDNNIGRLTNLITGLKIAIKGFDAKDIGDRFVCLLIIEVKNKSELENVINQIKNLKNILEVYRSEK
jgi:GTP pyrophosphokinase